MSRNNPGPGRPAAEPILLPAETISALTAEAQRFSQDKGALKEWLGPKRIFHVLLQDHIATLPIPGIKGVLQNSASSKLFLDMTEPLAAALEDVEMPDNKESHAELEVPRRVGKPAQRKGRSKRRKSH